MTMPITTNTTIATCIQIHVGDIAESVPRRRRGAFRAARDYLVGMATHLRKPAGRLALAGLALALLAGSPARAGVSRDAHGSSGSLLGGVNIGSARANAPAGEADRQIALAHELHAKVVRVEIPWSVMEPRGAGEVDPRALVYTDRVAEAAAANGMRVIMMVQNTPCWASSAPRSLRRACVPGKASKANSWPPADAGKFAAFVAYLAQRYGTRLAAIEIWNEPDQSNEAYFAGPNKAARYAAMLRAAYPAIKRADPTVSVLGGSLVGSNGAFLRALYAAGIKGFYDGLAVHYYNLTLASLRSIHETQTANGDSTPLWLDEFGWTSCWPHRKLQQEQGCVTARTQALDISNSFHAMSRLPYVAAAVLYKLWDSRNEEFGVVSAAGSHKPAWTAFSRVLTSPFGTLSGVTVSLRSRGGRVLASGSGPVGDFMQLEAFQGSVLRYRALFTLDRFNRYSVALPAVLGTHGLRVRVFRYGAGPSRAARKSI
ncbi:MAG TPA: cellulase family glycosylhydrolase [Solirubrobacteraceae bacterium]|nr:cellulase family glycosylhydrolase [Solirubrobacteraceae bacterium]